MIVNKHLTHIRHLNENICKHIEYARENFASIIRYCCENKIKIKLRMFDDYIFEITKIYYSVNEKDRDIQYFNFDMMWNGYITHITMDMIDLNFIPEYDEELNIVTIDLV